TAGSWSSTWPPTISRHRTVPSRQCLSCGRLTRGSYCARCAREREAQKLTRAPWIRIYSQPEWQTVKWKVHERDGYRCTYVDARGRCTQTSRTTRLEAHHLRKVRYLWGDAKGAWRSFMALALDPSNIVTLCYRHHMAADRPGFHV